MESWRESLSLVFKQPNFSAVFEEVDEHNPHPHNLLKFSSPFIPLILYNPETSLTSLIIPYLTSCCIMSSHFLN